MPDTKRRKFHAYLSYSNSDAVWAGKLKAGLEGYGLKVWLDRDEIRPGNTFVEDLEAALASCRTFVLIVSPQAIASSWVREEYHRAVSLAKQTERPLRLIPVILGKAELPGFLSMRNWVEFLDEVTFDNNLKRLVWGITGKRIEEAEVKPPPPIAPKNSEERVNPYIFERPAVGAHFYGRKADMARLVNALKEGRSVVVYGLQRVGKTSLVKEALDRELQNGHSLSDIRIDMYESADSLTSYIDFFETIVDRLCDHLSEAEYKKIREAARAILRTGSDAKEIRSRTTNLLTAYGARFGKPLIYIDEFQDIAKSLAKAERLGAGAHPLDSGFVKYLGSLIRKGIIQLLCCGRYQIQHMDKRLDWELLKLMVPIELSVLDEESTIRLITEPVEGRFTFDEAAVRKLIVLSGCYPYLVQYLCYELIEKARLDETTIIDEGAVGKLASMIQEPQLRLLYDDFQELDERLPWRILVSIAHLANAEREAVPWPEIAAEISTLGGASEFLDCGQALELLKNSQIIVEQGAENSLSYYIRPDVLRIWLREKNYFVKERLTRPAASARPQ